MKHALVKAWFYSLCVFSAVSVLALGCAARVLGPAEESSFPMRCGPRLQLGSFLSLFPA